MAADVLSRKASTSQISTSLYLNSSLQLLERRVHFERPCKVLCSDRADVVVLQAVHANKQRPSVATDVLAERQAHLSHSQNAGLSSSLERGESLVLLERHREVFGALRADAIFVKTAQSRHTVIGY